MSKRTFDPSRRNALKFGVLGMALAPMAGLVMVRNAAASDLPHVSEADPLAVSLKYKNDGSTAPRVDKAGTPAAEQVCGNCQLSQGEGEWLACSIFPGKAVNGNGWCTAWVKKA